jgi:hypothetical protein
MKALYTQSELYLQSLEFNHVKQKIKLSLVFILIGLFLSLVITFFYDGNRQALFASDIILIITIILNLITLTKAVQEPDSSRAFYQMQLTIYTSIILTYAIPSILILSYPSGDMFLGLILVYVINSTFVEKKAITLNLIFFIVIGSLFILGLPFNNYDMHLFGFPIVLNGYYVLDKGTLIMFLFIIVFFLAIASYMSLKRKEFFYNHISEIKESERRNIKKLFELKDLNKKDYLSNEDLLSRLELFGNSFEDSDIKEAFLTQLSILKSLETSSLEEVQQRYNEILSEDISELNQINFLKSDHAKLLSFKIAQLSFIKNKIEYTFSDKKYVTFNHYEDELSIKIIGFAVFYVLLRIDKSFFKKVEDKDIKNLVTKSGIEFKISSDILKVYLNNNDVFDMIVKSHLEGVII